jgi:hypothetical protein
MPSSFPRSADPAKFNTTLALFGMVLSQAAYCDDTAALQAWTCAPCKRAAAMGLVPVSPVSVFDGRVGGFGKISDWGTRAYVAALDQDRIVVSFRGSDNLTNWLEDFDIALQVEFEDACPTCQVHAGFFLSWMSLARDVSQKVIELKSQFPAADILVTGHSLGAAQAALAATHLYYREGLPVTHVYTYGQPRVGNAAFHQFYNNGTTDRQSGENGSSFRIVHYRDPVPLLPFQWMGYEHTSTEVWYSEDSSSFKVCERLIVGEDPTCANSMPLNPLLSEQHCSYLGTDICDC